MAIHAYSDLGTLKERNRSKRSSESQLALVPASTIHAKADRKTFVIFLSGVAAVGLLALLAINTMLAQDAFVLSRLETQATAINDQREAIMKKIATASSPGQLAFRAKAQGMVPSRSPRFLTVDGSKGADSTITFTKVNASH